MLPAILTVLTIWIPLAILKSFRRSQRIIVLMVILLHLGLIFLGHNLVLTQQYPAFFAGVGFSQGSPGEPIVMDGSVDAFHYYEKTEAFDTYFPFTITVDDIKRESNRASNPGYWWLIGTLRTMTQYPILAVRVLKTLLFFIGLACLMRVWRRSYGNHLITFSFIFLTVLYAVPLYYNFRNYKDGLLFGLFLIYMALLDTILRPRWQRSSSQTMSKTILAWILVFTIIWMISTIRFYYAVVLGSAILMHLVTASGMGFRMRAGLTAMIAVVSIFVIRGSIGDIFYSAVQKYGYSIVYGIYGMFRGLVSPIPWQYFLRFLIPSHCFYLLLLLVAAVAFFARFRKNLTWHLYVTAALVYVLGGMMGGDSAQRKRLVMIPIFIMWVLSYLAYKRGTHIEQQYQLPQEQEQPEDFCVYEEQPQPQLSE